MYSCRRLSVSALVLGLAIVGATVTPAFARSAHTMRPPSAADLGNPAGVADLPSVDALAGPPTPGRRPTGVAAKLADWIVVSDDADARPFMIVDKLAAKVFAYDADGRLLGSAPVLVGLAPGDDSAPGVGDLQLSAIAPDNRTTPAGRFEAKFGPSDGHGTVLWVDYADGIGMHPVITTNPAEHRLQRIGSASPEDHRISFGCINVPARFYHSVVETAFAEGGIVYVLPDTKLVQEVFPAFAAMDDVSEERETAARQDPCRASPFDVGDRIPDPQPSLSCPSSEPETADASPAP
jgi:hypothetical protein